MRDQEALRDRFKTRPPTKLDEFERGLSAFITLLEVVLGDDHSLPKKLNSYYDRLHADSELRRELTERMEHDTLLALNLALDIHIRSFNWFQDQERAHPNTVIGAPDFVKSLEELRDGRWNPPNAEMFGIPSAQQPNQALFAPLLNPTGTRPFPPNHPPAAAPAQHPPQQPPNTPPPPKPEPVHNDTPHTRIPLDDKFNVRKLRSERLEANFTCPKAGDVEMCLAYHKKGACFANCRRSSTHRKLTDAEAAALQSYLEGSSA